MSCHAPARRAERDGPASPRALIDAFSATLSALLALGEEENRRLCDPAGRLPLDLVRAKEDLATRYATLAEHLRAGMAGFDPPCRRALADLENDIRRLVALVKENQRLANEHKAASALRVNMIMQALAEQEKATQAGPTVCAPSPAGPTAGPLGGMAAPWPGAG
ncbi:hypothetical protein [Roseospirillum parvum]|uniref:FlgN protein n=1 Tax=Roseospirillum parvum TaxID=83401 RepID=A0A1G8ANV2_9PROT|nr:hypothetical protein [Roseospirillum parvum]SDH22584.1 hypothetical protein SAMN05421742_10557 [Roseospirillum parvum]